MPEAMRDYLDNYGWHFNKKACDYAVSGMEKRTSDQNRSEKVGPWSKQQVEQLLERENVKLENNKLYDFVYVANMAKADYYGSSIEDERHLALFVKDTIDDIDASPESAFRTWLAKMVGNGEPLEWEDLL